MRFSRTFFKFAAACAMASAVTTFLLWALPHTYTLPPTFDEQVALHTNARYLARLWVNFVHIFLAVVAYVATAVLLFRRSAALAGLGLLAFLLWGFTELLGVSVIIFAVNGAWRASYATSDAAAREVLKASVNAFYEVWNAMFFLLLVGFLFGTLCYGLASWRGRGLERTVSVLFLLAAPLTILIMAGEYAGMTWADSVQSWSYPVLQPVSRLILGVWLWKAGEGALSLTALEGAKQDRVPAA